MRRRLIVLFSVITVMTMSMGVLIYDAYHQLAWQSANDEDLIVEIPAGRRFAQILDILQQAEVRLNRYHAYAYAGWKGTYSRMQAGTYSIPAGATVIDILDKLARGEVIVKKFTIVEGWTLADIIASMKHNPYIRMDADHPDELARHVGVKTLEGWIRPDTYEFHVGTGNIEILRRGYADMRDVLTRVWAERATDLPLETPYQALVLASIIEKETAVDHERARIAGVFLTRLKRNMRLQSDPTVIYGMGKRFDGDLRSADLRNDTPYNTYKRKGLPPTPIAMPSEASLRAAVKPEVTGDLYFVAKPDGTHYFSKSYEEHRAAVKRYQ